jgi:UDP-N-acetylglucosamine:LPS N-acetylglucosamine transferase
LLFISGSIGLGHIGRDLEIVRELRKLDPQIQISWLAQDPASRILLEQGEKLLSESAQLAKENEELEKSTKGYDANLTKTIMNMRKAWGENVNLVGDLVNREKFDLVIGDETYDLIIDRVENKNFQRYPFIMIYDFIGVDSVTHNPIDIIATYLINRLWAKGLVADPPLSNRNLFIGEKEDISDRKFGFLLPNRREAAQKSVDFVGYIVKFDPKQYMDKASMRQQLGYGKGKLIVCSIGGTSAGSELMNLCAKAFSIIQKDEPDVQMVLVGGPRYLPVTAPVTGLEVKGYVPDLFKHFAAADLCIVTGGGTTTLELIALQKPFLYFPLSSHFEQLVDVSERCQRFNAGVRMTFEKTTPQDLAKTVLANLNSQPKYSTFRISGAQNAAQIINHEIERVGSG